MAAERAVVDDKVQRIIDLKKQVRLGGCSCACCQAALLCLIWSCMHAVALG